jgi:hypothetical protein
MGRTYRHGRFSGHGRTGTDGYRSGRIGPIQTGGLNGCRDASYRARAEPAGRIQDVTDELVSTGTDIL